MIWVLCLGYWRRVSPEGLISMLGMLVVHLGMDYVQGGRKGLVKWGNAVTLVM